MRVSVNGVRLFFDVEGAKFAPDGPVMREKPTLLLLHGGEIARIGAPGDVLEQSLLERVFGCRVTVDKSASGRPVVHLAYERG